MSWLSDMAEILYPLLNGSVISAYAGMITYTNYRDRPKYVFIRYFTEIPIYLLLTAITALALWAVGSAASLFYFVMGSVTSYPLPAAITWWTLVMSMKPGMSPARSTAQATGYFIVIGISVLLSGRMFDDTSVWRVEAVAVGIICWTVLAIARLYMLRNWRVPVLGLPVVFVTLVATASVVYHEGGMDEHLPAIIGLVLAAVATLLAFTFGNATPLQRQIILTLAALAGGAIATEIPGFLKVDVSLGAKTGIAAGGAIAVFVILYFWSARAPRE